MTIKELKTLLDSFPEDTLVMHKGYEGGYGDSLLPTSTSDMYLDVHGEDEWYYGPHELKEDVPEGDYKVVKAIIL